MMLFGMSLEHMRRLVAVLLLCGVFLAGTVDAVACEPLFEEASHAAAAPEEHGGDKSTPGGEKHGLCAHGHCHHGGQLVQSEAAIGTVGLTATEYRTEPAGPLHSATLDSLQRPPRP
jgi:hypothetical protein